MENSYGIGITNRFLSLIDDEDFGTGPEEIEEEKKKNQGQGKKAGTKPTTEKENRSKDTAADTQKNTAAKKGIRDNNQKGTGGPFPPKKESNNAGNDAGRVKFTEGGREERNNKRNKEEVLKSDADLGSRTGSRRGGFRGERGARGAVRGGRGGGGGFRKREFERQSGSDKSGVKPIDKRDGAGSRNWGTYKDDLAEDVSGNQTGGDESSEEKARESENPEDRGTGDEKENQNESAKGPTEEQPKLMTLEEWKALQQPRAQPIFDIRKPDASKMMLIKKGKGEEGEEEHEEEEEEEYYCLQRSSRQKKVVEMDFIFNMDSRRGARGGGSGRGGAGGRGSGGGGSGGGGGGSGFRGGRGRGKREDDRQPKKIAPKVDDLEAFPTL